MEKELIKEEFEKIKDIKINPYKENKEILDPDKISADELKQYRQDLGRFSEQQN